MLARAVGQDELAAGKRLDRGAQRRVELDRGVVDVVGEVEEGVGVDVVLLDEAAQRRAVAVVEVLLQRPRRQAVEPEQLHDVERDALVDLRPHPRLVRIERVVEVEDPGVDLLEAARGRGGDVGGRRDDVHAADENGAEAAPRSMT
jgi:hypothetical protein